MEIFPEKSRDSGPAIRVSDLSSGSSDNEGLNPTTDFIDRNEPASDDEGANNAATPISGGDGSTYYNDHKEQQVFKVYAGYGGGGSSFGPLATGGWEDGDGAGRKATVSRAYEMEQSSTRRGCWMTAETPETTRSTSRTAVWLPRVVGDCGRVHKRETMDWGPGRGWNVSTLPIYRSPGSPSNRLFGNMTESRPRREPKALLERQAYYYAPQPSPPRNRLPDHLRFGLHNWDPSISPKQVSHRRKAHSRSSPSQRRLQKNVGHTSPPPQKAGSAGLGQSYHRHQQTKRSRKEKNWDLCTAPRWTVTSKYNQFENIQDRRNCPRVRDNPYTGVKSQYKKPSTKFLRLREERQLEARRREEYLTLDMKYYSSSMDDRGRVLGHRNLMQKIAQIAPA